MREPEIQRPLSKRVEALLRMHLTPGLGPALAHRLLSVVPAPEALFGLGEKDLVGMGAPPDAARELLSARTLDRARAEWARVHALGFRIVDIADAAYPPLLRETPDPPMLLYLRGRRWAPERPHVAVVGARNATRYGLQAAEQLAGDLAARGVVVTSGLARGIDAAAHRAALEHGQTVAVLGTGLDRVYPPEHRKLAEQVEEKGALITEFPLGVPPLAWNFPLRNRLLAGMSLGVVIVEAAEKSGSLITARLALEANREVFAVPGPIYSPGSAGPHRLIRDGAVLVTGWQDILAELGIMESSVINDRGVPARPGPDGAPAGPLAAPLRRVLDAIPPGEEVALDALLDRLDLARAEVYTALLQLELKGCVRALPSDRFARTGLGEVASGGAVR